MGRGSMGYHRNIEESNLVGSQGTGLGPEGLAEVSKMKWKGLLRSSLMESCLETVAVVHLRHNGA